MNSKSELMKSIKADAKSADKLHLESRALLTRAVRTGAAGGLTQREIAAAVGRSQPEVSRLLRFHGNTERARALVACRQTVLEVIREYRGRNPQVFGSVALGRDTDDSDIDLLVEFDSSPSLMCLARLERALSGSVGYPVEVTPAGNLPTHMRKRINQEAIPL